MRLLAIALSLLLAPAALAQRRTLESLADDLAGDAASARGHVAVTVRGGSPGLRQAVGDLLRTRLERGGKVRSARSAEGLAAARAAGFDQWLDLELRVEAGRLVATGRLVPAARDLWRELALGSEPGALATLFADGPADAEVRAHLGTPQPAAAPPRPARRWAFRQLRAPLDLGAEVLAMTAADLDGDRRAELIALTAAEVVVVAVEPQGVRIVRRLALPGAAPVPRPRFPLGTLVVADLAGDTTPEIAARTSERDAGAIFAARAGAWTRLAGFAGFPLCALPEASGRARLGTAPLEPGVPLLRRDGGAWRLVGDDGALSEGATPAWWAALPDPLLGLACAPVGAHEAALAVLDKGGVLRVSAAGVTAVLGDVGHGFVVGDLDGDGRLEVTASAHRAPGDGDQLTVWSLVPGGDPRLVHRSPPLKGGVVALAAGDFDGDGGAEAIAAVRLMGSTRNDLWLLD